MALFCGRSTCWRSDCAKSLLMMSTLTSTLSELASSKAPAKAPPPHIVYVLSDNLGYGGVGYLRAVSPSGPSPEVRTPNVDALAADGVVLTSFYTWKFCSPSRSALLSGRHPIHVNIHNDGAWAPEFGIPENMTLLPRKLAAFGYKSHHLGKWHVGMSTPSRTRFRQLAWLHVWTE